MLAPIPDFQARLAEADVPDGCPASLIGCAQVDQWLVQFPCVLAKLLGERLHVDHPAVTIRECQPSSPRAERQRVDCPGPGRYPVTTNSIDDSSVAEATDLDPRGRARIVGDVTQMIVDGH